jgi:sensor c-di-GMP phosphodiesterase-like protein
MEDKLRKHIEGLFTDAPPTKKAVELREEMIQNLTEKYRDLLAEGKSPEAAYNATAAGIGDVDYLIEELKKDIENNLNLSGLRHRTAMYTAIAVMLYILSPVPLVIFTVLTPRGSWMMFGTVLLRAIAAAATGILIYSSMTKPKFMKQDDTMVEEFKEWQHETREKRTVRRAISSALWCVITVAYFLISFKTGAWYISWIIFICGGAVESLLSIFFTLKK